MSVELEPRNFSLRAADLEQMASAWLGACPIPAEVVRIPDDTLQFFIAGTSIRGFSVAWRWSWFRNRVDLRLSVAASLGDWQAAYSFMRFARARGFEVRSEDGVVLGADALSENAALDRARNQFAQDISFLQHLMVSSAGESVVELPNARFAVPVWFTDLPDGPAKSDAIDSVHALLQSRAAKYSMARSAALITLKTGETAVVWSGDALLAPLAHHIVLGRGDFDSANCVYVSWDYAMRELEGIVERNQRDPARYYFAEVGADEPRWKRLVGAGAPIDQLGEPAV